MSACPNPWCNDGWVTVSQAEPKERPCYCCRKHLGPAPKQNEDRHTSTVDGAAAHARSMHRDLFGRYQ